MPPATRVWIIRLAFSGEDRGAIEERTIHNITVAGDPTRVGDTEVDILFFEIEDIFRSDVGPDHVAAVDMDHTFGFSGSAGCIEDV